MDEVAAILDRDLSNRFVDPEHPRGRPAPDPLRPAQHRQRHQAAHPVGADYTPEYNAWLDSIPQHIKELVYVVKRFYRPEWGADWRSHFTVGIINGRQGVALRLDGDKIMVNMLRVGFDHDGSWRLFGLRHDFNPAVKVQTEDDITASIVAPPHVAGLGRRSFAQVRPELREPAVPAS